MNEDNYGDNEENYHQEVNYSGYGSKGYGLKGKGLQPLGEGEGQKCRKGGGGGGKTGGFNKGGGKGKGGKGKGGQKGEFQGTCRWCGKWCHTASRCSDKDAYMECVRGENGPANHSQETAKETYNLQNEDEEGWRTVGGLLSSLDKAPRFVNVCSLHANYRKNFPEDLGVERDSLKWQGKGVRWAEKFDISNVGCFSDKEVELSTVRDDTFLELTIDSGAGENVMSEHMAPRTLVQVSREQQAGVMYTAANGRSCRTGERKFSR